MFVFFIKPQDIISEYRDFVVGYIKLNEVHFFADSRIEPQCVKSHVFPSGVQEGINSTSYVSETSSLPGGCVNHHKAG
jgi:hypothetical protein